LTQEYNLTNQDDPLANNLNENIMIDKNQATSSKGLFKFINMKIITKPNSSINLKIIIYREKDFFFQSTPSNSEIDWNNYSNRLTLVSQVKFFVRPCIRGEILMPDYSCHICNKGK
jgi:hypothetical protein